MNICDIVLLVLFRYKGRREFFRWTPKENPTMKTFTVSGINVLVSMMQYTVINNDNGFHKC